MKNKTQNPYQTNKGGRIEAPKPQKDEPRASVISGEDLRIKAKGGKK